MNLPRKIKVAVAGALIALASFVLGVRNPDAPILGDASASLDGYATTTNTQALFQNYTVIQSPTGKGALSPAGTRIATSAPTFLTGLTITTVGTSAFCLYDATSTVPNGEWATTTIACFPASVAVGHYPLNYPAQKGVLVEWTGSPTTATRASTTFQFR